MSPVQIIRALATASIAAGVALGLVPTGPCGAGWWSFPMPERSFGWFDYESTSIPPIGPGACETVMAPVGSWAIALVAAGVALLVTLRMNTGAEPRTSRMSR